MALLTGAWLIGGCAVGTGYKEWHADTKLGWSIDESRLPGGKITEEAQCVYKTVKKMEAVAFSAGSFRKPYGEALLKIIDKACPSDFNASLHAYAVEIIDKDGHDDFSKISDAAFKYGVRWDLKK